MKKKLNILMATMQMGFGGAETHIFELARALTQNGHSVTVASAGGKYADMLEQEGVRHVTLPLNTKNPLMVLRSYFGLSALLRAEHFDVVHAHARIPAFICGRLQKKLHFKFVTTAHWVFRITPLWKRIANWGDRVMAVSEDIKQYLIDNYGYFADHIFITVNGVDADTFSPNADWTQIREEIGLSHSKHRIVSVSRMDESRGYAQLCLARTAEKLLEKYPDLEIVIVGDGVISSERNLLPEVRRIADGLEEKYGRKIIFTPGLRTDTHRFMAAGDLFIGASRAALEAMSCQKPVIVAGNEGYIGIFGPDKEEIAYKTNFCCRGLEQTTPERIFRDVCALFDGGRAALAKKGAFCRETILKNYSAARTARDYEQLYNSLPEALPTERGNILISGYYGFGNAGDDSIAASLIRNIRLADPAAKITVFCKKPKQSGKKYAVRAVGRFNLPAILLEMRYAKLLISGGGNLLQNTTSSRSLFYYTTIIQLAKRMGLKVFICSNGVGPVFGKRHEREVVRTLERADAITFREPQSIEYVRSLGFDAAKIRLSADPALTLEAAPAERIDYILRDTPAVKFFAVSLRSFSALHSKEVAGVDEAGFAVQAAAEIDKIAAATGALPLYLIMQSSRDRALSETVNENAKNKGVILSGLTAAEILGVLSRCSLVISMRLHLLIYGAAAAKPLVGLTYDPKVDSMLAYMGYEPPLPLTALREGALAEIAVRRFGQDAPCARIEELKALALDDAKTAVQMTKT